MKFGTTLIHVTPREERSAPSSTSTSSKQAVGPAAGMNNSYSQFCYPNADEDDDETEIEQPSLTNSSVSNVDTTDVTDGYYYEENEMSSHRYHHGHSLQQRRVDVSMNSNANANDNESMDMNHSKLHSSLLDQDMTRDDSCDEEEEDLLHPHDEDDDPLSSTNRYHTASHTANHSNHNQHMHNDQTNPSSSTIKQKEDKTSLVDTVSESLTESFCNSGPADNSCSFSDCNLHLQQQYNSLSNQSTQSHHSSNSSSSTSSSSRLMSDYIVQNRLLQDFHYLLGSTKLPCLEEKDLYTSCLQALHHPDSDNEQHQYNQQQQQQQQMIADNDLFASWRQERLGNDFVNGEYVPTKKREIRNRARESWRARAYRIKKLREGSMLVDMDHHHHHHSSLHTAAQSAKSSLHSSMIYPLSTVAISASTSATTTAANGANTCSTTQSKPLVYSYSVDGARCGPNPTQSHTLSKQQMNHSSNYQKYNQNSSTTDSLQHQLSQTCGILPSSTTLGGGRRSRCTSPSTSPNRRNNSSSSSNSNNNNNNNNNHNSKKSKLQEVNADPLGCIIGDCIEPISHVAGETNEMEVVLWKQLDEFAEEQDYCYDSDPGEVYLRGGLNDLSLTKGANGGGGVGGVGGVSGDAAAVSGTNGSDGIENGVESSIGYNVVRSSSDRAPGDRGTGSTNVGKKTSGANSGKVPLKRRRRMHFDSVLDRSESTSKEENHPTKEDKYNRYIQETDRKFHQNEQQQQQQQQQFGHGAIMVDDVEEGPLVPEEKDDLNNWNNTGLANRQLSMQSDDLVHDVQEALNRTWTLTWHPQSNQTSKTIGRSSPRIIQLWLERGNRIRSNDIVEPKMMWRDTLQPSNIASSRQILNITPPPPNSSQSSKKNTHHARTSSTSSDVGVSTSGGGVGISGLGVGSATGISGGPYQICLLSICRVLETSSSSPRGQGIDRQKYPFAKTSCSIILRTCNDEEYLFEARNEGERDRIVYLWKLVVARLASQAVVGDSEGMVQEYFVPTSFGVP